MKKISFVVGRDYLNNRIFDLRNTSLNRDDCLLPFYLLKEKLNDLGFTIGTQDIIDPSIADIVLYNEMPKPYVSNIQKEKSYLVIFESELIRPDNWSLDKHQSFKRIFTWNDLYVDGEKYIKFNFPNNIKTTQVESCKRGKLLTLISGNKTCTHQLELYSKRLETIRWFEKNHPEVFDYYGVGWEHKMSMWWQKLFKKLRLIKLIPQNPSICYKGRVDSKFNTLKEYQFSICYENGRDIHGYITEKIIDCFMSGNIPIYWGANNIEEHIPSNTFIDRKIFSTYEELYHYIDGMKLDQIQEYQENILDFLKSDKGQTFSNEFFVDVLTKGMLSD